MPSTSVVICSRGRPDLLLDTVESVLAMNRLPDELVVIDQSDEPQSDLATGAVDTSIPLLYKWAPDRGLSRARNAGLTHSSGDIVAFLDDDILVHPDWLHEIVEALTERAQGNERYVISGQVLPGAPEVPGAWAPATVLHTEPQSHSGKLRKDVLPGGNMAAYRAAFEEVGPFDERLGAGAPLPAAEDNDLGYRLLQAGYTLQHRPEVVAYHRSWREGGALLRLKYDYGRGQGGFYVKHILNGDWFMVHRFAADAYRHLERALQRAAARRFRDAGSDVSYTFGLLVGGYGWLRAR